MPIQRILVVQSVEDAITRYRNQVITLNPLLRAYDFTFAYAIPLNNMQKRMSIPAMMGQLFEQPIDDYELEERLALQIMAAKPDLVVVYYGAILRHFTNELMCALKILRARFPYVTFGIQTTYPLSTIPDAALVFDRSPDVHSLVQLIFPQSG